MKKLDALVIDKTYAFAKQCYAQKQSCAGRDLLSHCTAVARQAELIAVKLFNDLRPEYHAENAQETIAIIVHCALLHDVLNVSACTFENIAEAANVQIAAMVAALSRDFRLVETKRDMEYRGRLSQSAVGAQIVAVASAICTLKALMKLTDETGLKTAKKTKKILAQIDGDLLAIHAANKYYTLRLYAHAAKNMITDISQKLKAHKQQARLQKSLEQTKKRIQSKTVNTEQPKGAAKQKKQKVKSETARPRKKRKISRYARKRNSDSDT